MANTFLTPEVIAKQAVATLHETLVMKQLVHVDLTQEFKSAKVGDTINVKKPATFVAKDFDRRRGIELQDATQSNIAVKLDKFKDVSFSVTSEELALDIVDFDEELLTPAMQAIALGMDSSLLDVRKDVVNTAGSKSGFEITKPEVLIDAGAILDVNKVPVEDRFAVVGPYTKANWLNSPILKQVDQSGSTEALRRASLGKDLFGFETYYTNNIKPPAGHPEPGTPTTEIGLAFHKNAIAFASAPTEIPPGAVGHVETYKGVSVRVIFQYDITKKQTVVSVDTLFGLKLLDPNMAVLLKGADAEGLED